jgi:hypothetical protein
MCKFQDKDGWILNFCLLRNVKRKNILESPSGSGTIEIWHCCACASCRNYVRGMRLGNWSTSFYLWHLTVVSGVEPSDWPVYNSIKNLMLPVVLAKVIFSSSMLKLDSW